MSRIPDSALRLQWQRRLLKFQAFHGSVRQFCLDEGISVASFYLWQAKLDVDRNSTKNKIQTATGRSNAGRNAKANAERNTNAAHFVPLQLVQQAACHTPPTHLVEDKHLAQKLENDDLLKLAFSVAASVISTIRISSNSTWAT